MLIIDQSPKNRGCTVVDVSPGDVVTSVELQTGAFYVVTSTQSEDGTCELVNLADGAVRNVPQRCLVTIHDVTLTVKS